MTKKKQKEFDIPESVCLFSKSEIEYINHASKPIPYRVDVQKAEILVPPDHMEQAEDNLSVRHLVTKFSFAVQSTIGAEYMPNKEFNPVMRIKSQPKEFKATGITEIGIGFEFKDARDYNKVKRIFSDKGRDWTIQHINDMRPNYALSKISFDIMLKDKLYLPCQE